MSLIYRCTPLVVALVSGAYLVVVAPGSFHDVPETRSTWSVDLHRYGWMPPPSESNRAFLENFSISKLAALDMATRVAFVDDKTIVAYHSRQITEHDQRKPGRYLEAWFLQSNDGSLRRKTQWHTAVRKDNGQADSEGRIFSYSNGKFIVDADGTITLYDASLRTITQQRLEPFGATDMWGLQLLEDGELFLRYESLTQSSVRYEWRDGSTFQLLRSMPGSIMRGRNVRSANRGLITQCKGGGVCVLDPTGQIHIVCNDSFCRDEDVNVNALIGTHMLGISSFRRGVGVVDDARGLLWFDEAAPRTHGAPDCQMGETRVARSGARFGVWVSGYHNCVFDSTDVSSLPLIIFVFDATNPRSIFRVQIDRRGTMDFALSQDGRAMAVLNGSEVSLYRIE